MDTELANRQKEVIAQGCLTNSKHASAFVEGVYATHVDHSSKCWITTTTKQTLFDTYGALGTISLGHSHPQVNQAAVTAIQTCGPSHSLPSRYEVLAAEELLTNYFSTFDCVKYLKTGAEATSCAIRMARSKTGRGLILTQGYHGWHDHWISTKPNPKGLFNTDFGMQEVETIDDCIETIKGEGGLYAAVIVEPIMLEYSESILQSLQALVEICRDKGVVCIFDEIVSGTRVPNFFVSRTVVPDIVCLGKGIANGFALSAVVSKKTLGQDTPYFVSSTFAGETHALAAHRETMKQLKAQPMEELFERANQLQDEINAKLPPEIRLKGYGTRAYWMTDDIHKLSLLFQEFYLAKVFVGRSWFVNFSHMEQWELFRSFIFDALDKFQYSKTLLGNPIVEPLKRV